MPTAPVPNFFIAGAPKTGTSSLYHYLDQHPQIYMSPIKEPCYFADEFRFDNLTGETQRDVRREEGDLADYLRGPMSAKRMTGFVREWQDYLRLFQKVTTETAIGEASVCYLWSRTAPSRIVSQVPHPRVIAILRDPAERVFSAYLHLVSRELVRMSFREYVDAALQCKSQRIGRFYPLLEFGLYYEQVRRYRELFPPERFRIYFYDDYRKDPLRLLADVFRFLSVDDSFVPDMSQRYVQPRIPRFLAATRFLKELGVWKRTKQIFPSRLLSRLQGAAYRPRASVAPRPEDRSILVDYYRDDIGKLSSLLERDLSSWFALPE